MVVSLCGCENKKSDDTSKEVKKEVEKQDTKKENSYEFSDNIYLAINSGAAGYGTVGDTTDATIIIYKDKTIKVFMDTEENPELASLHMSEEDYKKLTEIANLEKIATLSATPDYDVCDGSNYYIKLYDKDDNVVVNKGGYMPVEDEFWDMYKAIKEILKPYNISEIVDEYRHDVIDESDD